MDPETKYLTQLMDPVKGGRSVFDGRCAALVIDKIFEGREHIAFLLVP